MRAFQDEGHKAVLIIGDYTTRIGDPSGRSSERPILPDEEIDSNAQRYLEQAMTISPRRPGAARGPATTASGSRSCPTPTSSGSAASSRSRGMLERDDFEKRFRAGEPISVSELLYPLMQAYDSVAIEADVEIGGTDQLYNLLAGREVMEALRPRAAGRAHDPLLLSWDGEKMSSSRRQQHPAHGCAGGDVRPDDADPGLDAARTGTASSPSARCPRATPWTAKLELARLDRRPLARRGRGARRPRSTSRASSARAQAPEDIEEVHLRRLPTSPSTCPRSLQAQLGQTVEPLAPRHRPGRRQARRRARHRLRRPVGRPRRRDPAGRQAAVLAAPCAVELLFLGCPKGRRWKVPAIRHNWSASRTIRNEKSEHPEASGASRGLFFCVARPVVRSLKTQQRAFTSRPRPVGFGQPEEESTQPVLSPSGGRL